LISPTASFIGGGAVLAPADHHPVDADDALLAGGEVAVDVAVMLAAIGLGHQQADVAAERLLFRIAELAHGGLVEGGDGAVLVDHHRGVRGGVEEDAKMRLACIERGFGLVDGAPGMDQHLAHPHDQPARQEVDGEFYDVLKQVAPEAAQIDDAGQRDDERRQAGADASGNRSHQDRRHEQDEQRTLAEDVVQGQPEQEGGGDCRNGKRVARHPLEATGKYRLEEAALRVGYVSGRHRFRTCRGLRISRARAGSVLRGNAHRRTHSKRLRPRKARSSPRRPAAT